MLKGRTEYIVTYPAVRIINCVRARARAYTDYTSYAKFPFNITRAIAAIIIINVEPTTQFHSARHCARAERASPPRSKRRPSNTNQIS